MAEDEARIKKEAEEKASREPKSIPVIGGHTETEDSGKVGWKSIGNKYGLFVIH